MAQITCNLILSQGETGLKMRLYSVSTGAELNGLGYELTELTSGVFQATVNETRTEDLRADIIDANGDLLASDWLYLAETTVGIEPVTKGVNLSLSSIQEIKDIVDDTEPSVDVETVVINDSQGNPLKDVFCWVTTDSDGMNIVANDRTDVFGRASFFLDPGDYYLWQRKDGFTFTNPQPIEVS